jgi:hypothetical protein
MKEKKVNLIAACTFVILSIACRQSPDSGYQPPSSSSSSSSSTGSTSSTSNQGLTNAKVETAVADLLSDWRMGGSVSVKGIQEIPQQNSAIADLQFNNFEYGATFEGGLLRKKDFKPRKPSGDAIPHPDEMFPQRKISYSKDGKATLSKYNDGRWVLKAVNWGFDTGVKGNLEIR